MKKYYREVRELDEGKISIKEFIKRVTRPRGKITDIDATVAYVVYVQDGGTKYTFRDFIKEVEEKITGLEPEELLRIAKEEFFMTN